MSSLNTYPNIDLSMAIPLDEARRNIEALPFVGNFVTTIDLSTPGYEAVLPHLEDSFAARLKCEKDADGAYRRSFSTGAVLSSLFKVYEKRFLTTPAVLVAEVSLEEENPQVNYQLPVNVTGHRNKAVAINTVYDARDRKSGRSAATYKTLGRQARQPKQVPNPFYVKTSPITDGSAVSPNRILGKARGQGRAGGTSH